MLAILTSVIAVKPLAHDLISPESHLFFRVIPVFIPFFATLESVSLVSPLFQATFPFIILIFSI
jgi:hypothetical protein